MEPVPGTSCDTFQYPADDELYGKPELIVRTEECE